MCQIMCSRGKLDYTRGGDKLGLASCSKQKQKVVFYPYTQGLEIIARPQSEHNHVTTCKASAMSFCMYKRCDICTLSFLVPPFTTSSVKYLQNNGPRNG